MQVTYVGQDDWSRNLYKSTKTGYIYVEVDGQLYVRSAAPWFEPDYPLVSMKEIVIVERGEE